MTPQRTWPVVATAVVALLGGAHACRAQSNLPVRATTNGVAIQNLRAFARLYGYVRWFHPSDEAAAIDWDRFAVYGTRQVAAARTPNELATALRKLFQPIAPTIRVYPAGTHPDRPALIPPDTAGFQVVAWQHEGVELATRGQYRSIRLHRPDPGVEPEGQVYAQVGAGGLQGKRLRLSAEARLADGGSAQLHLAMVVGRESGRGFADFMRDRPITSGEWSSYEIVGPVAKDATDVTLAAVLVGVGEARVRRLRLQVEDGSGWRDVDGLDTRFRSLLPGDSTITDGGWGVGSRGGEHRIEVADEGGGEPTLVLALDRQAAAEPLFSEHPKLGDATDAPLARELRAWVPLALDGDGHATFPAAPDDALRRLHAALDSIDLGAADATDAAVRFADVVIAWNVIQHFYPYFDVVHTDWDAALTRALLEARADTGALDFHGTLTRMLEPLDDAHADVFHPLFREWRGIPVSVDWIEDRVVVTASKDTTTARPGDVVRSIDGEPVTQWLEKAMAEVSGSDGWRHYRALTHPFRGFGRGEPGTEARLEVDREGQVVTTAHIRDAEGAPQPARPADFAEVAEGIRYVDLTRTRLADVEAHIEELAAARGVIFDLRGYPTDNDVREVLGHLSADTLRSEHWDVPRVIRPDREELVGWRTAQWTIAPRPPLLHGEVVFLSDARAVSFPEGVLGLVEAYHLAPIVGRPTAGVTGNVNPFDLPGGYRMSWTGMRYLKPDGTRHQGIGVRPTVPVRRTVAAVREGRDEDLEAAVRLMETSTSTEPGSRALGGGHLEDPTRVTTSVNPESTRAATQRGCAGQR